MTIHHDTYPDIDPTRVDLKGKYVFITGASKGVGKAAAISFARAGVAGIALGARSSLSNVIEEIKLAAEHVGQPGPRIIALKLDVTSRESVELAAKRISDDFEGRLDVLINNAGYLSNEIPLVDTDPDEWWYEYAVNVKGPYLVTRACLPLLVKSSHKIVLNISSVGAHMVGSCSSSYATGKLALLRFTEVIDAESGPGTKDGVIAIAMHPGGVMTELASHLHERFHERLIDTAALSGDSLVWLAKERREWLAGRYISANWDVKELEDKKDDILRGDLLKVRMAVNMFDSA